MEEPHNRGFMTRRHLSRYKDTHRYPLLVPVVGEGVMSLELVKALVLEPGFLAVEREKSTFAFDKDIVSRQFLGRPSIYVLQVSRDQLLNKGFVFTCILDDLQSIFRPFPLSGLVIVCWENLFEGCFAFLVALLHALERLLLFGCPRRRPSHDRVVGDRRSIWA